MLKVLGWIPSNTHTHTHTHTHMQITKTKRRKTIRVKTVWFKVLGFWVAATVGIAYGN
jgi:hypothetical protein